MSRMIFPLSRRVSYRIFERWSWCFFERWALVFFCVFAWIVRSQKGFFVREVGTGVFCVIAWIASSQKVSAIAKYRQPIQQKAKKVKKNRANSRNPKVRRGDVSNGYRPPGS